MAAMRYRVGQEVWLPCEVRPGPFPNEKRVYVKLGDAEWVGFVNTRALREWSGGMQVRGVVTAVGPGNALRVAVRGHSPASVSLETRRDVISGYVGALEA